MNYSNNTGTKTMVPVKDLSSITSQVSIINSQVGELGVILQIMDNHIHGTKPEEAKNGILPHNGIDTTLNTVRSELENLIKHARYLSSRLGD